MNHIGKTLYGFCNGFFGSSSYSTKTIEAQGKDWIVARDEDGIPHFASFMGGWESRMDKFINDWCKS